MGDTIKIFAWFNDDGSPYWWFERVDIDYGEPTLTLEVDEDLITAYEAATAASAAAREALRAAAGLDPFAGRLLVPCAKFNPEGGEPFTYTRPAGTTITWYGDCTTCGHDHEAHEEAARG